MKKVIILMALSSLLASCAQEDAQQASAGAEAMGAESEVSATSELPPTTPDSYY